MKVLRLLAVISFVAGVGLLVAGFVANSNGQAESNTHAAPPEFTSTPTPTPEAATEAPTPTPTPPPFDGALASFQIPKLKVDAPVEDIALLPDNRLDVPHNPHNVGWYDIYDKPGFGGNAVFSAHVDYWPNIRGPFYNLRNLVAGDEVTVVMEDGTQYHYRVISYKRYPVDQIPMGDLIWPKDRPPGVEWITMITCGGRFEATSSEGWGEYLDRDVVVAERIYP